MSNLCFKFYNKKLCIKGCWFSIKNLGLFATNYSFSTKSNETVNNNALHQVSPWYMYKIAYLYYSLYSSFDTIEVWKVRTKMATVGVILRFMIFVRTFQTSTVSKLQIKWIIEIGHFVHIQRGNLMQSIIIYCFIAFNRK